MAKYTLHLSQEELGEIHIALLHRRDKLTRWSHPDLDKHSYNVLKKHLALTNHLIAIMDGEDGE